jgi:hypothetical protein
MCLDQRLRERTKLVLLRLGLYLNIETGRCDPKIRDLAMMTGLGESDSAKRAARRAVKEGEKFGWIKRHERHGGNAALYSQSNQYVFTIPKEFPKASGHPSPLATPLASGQIGLTRGHPSPPRTEKNLEHKKERGEDKVGLPRGPAAPKEVKKYISFDSPHWETLERWERGVPPTQRPARDKRGGCWLTDNQWRLATMNGSAIATGVSS